MTQGGGVLRRKEKALHQPGQDSAKKGTKSRGEPQAVSDLEFTQSIECGADATRLIVSEHQCEPQQPESDARTQVSASCMQADLYWAGVCYDELAG